MQAKEAEGDWVRGMGKGGKEGHRPPSNNAQNASSPRTVWQEKEEQAPAGLGGRGKEEGAPARAGEGNTDPQKGSK